MRFLIQDTGPSSWEFSDEEINYFITAQGGAVAAAIYALTILASKYTDEAEGQATGGINKSYGNRAEKYRTMAAELRAHYAGPIPYCAGISEADKETDEDNDDMVSSRFSRGQFKNPEVP